jgi:1-deoxy-D-xylulose-5-phosphate reductoisomerase
VNSQKLCILGSTGSIGESTLDVISRNPERFEVIALTANRNTGKLAEQCARFGARLAVVADPQLQDQLAADLQRAGSTAEVLCGEKGLVTAATLDEIDAVMAAIVGAAGLQPTFHAARCGKRILLANKESLVIAGEIFIAEARRNGAQVLPVDSEHNASSSHCPRISKAASTKPG